LDSNSATPLEDLREDSPEAGLVDLQPGVEAKSLVCNECGKRFRSTTYAEAHAERSGHTDFSESTEEIAPLTQEEKKAKLSELREKLAAKRSELSEQDKIDKKRNEEINRKKTKETQDLKEELKKKEQIKDAENKRKEKQADIEAKKRIQAKIAADKEERRLRAEREKAEREGRAAAVPSTAPAAAALPVSSKPASAYTETRLRLQTASGNVIKTYPVETTLFEVAAELNNESGLEVESFTQNFPKKTFNRDFFGETLKELKLVPSASLIVK
jgi:UBX domain-containing protein 1/4